MRRRDFVASVVAGAAGTWPFAGRAQQKGLFVMAPQPFVLGIPDTAIADLKTLGSLDSLMPRRANHGLMAPASSIFATWFPTGRIDSTGALKKQP
jgi:hypothetical protein